MAIVHQRNHYVLIELTRKRVPSRGAGLISGMIRNLLRKIERSAEALWAYHCPISIPPT
jgi:hypothetical protein